MITAAANDMIDCIIPAIECPSLAVQACQKRLLLSSVDSAKHPVLHEPAIDVTNASRQGVERTTDAGLVSRPRRALIQQHRPTVDMVDCVR